jgi:hypothetical protein
MVIKSRKIFGYESLVGKAEVKGPAERLRIILKWSLRK